jgi:5'(3')-deoxyribonucleotidase
MTITERAMTKKIRILVDMDEVLVDFVDAACRIHGRNVGDVLLSWPKDTWNMAQALGLSQGDFWHPIYIAGEKFWEQLQPKPWIKNLLREVKSLTDDWHIISSPTRHSECYSGKVKWLKEYFGSTFDQFALTPHKHIFAQENVVLIDDHDDNVEKFVEAGGMGILFPAKYNANSDWASDPVPYVRHQLQGCSCF